MTMTMTAPVMTAKQHNYIVDLAAKRPNWIIKLPVHIQQTVTDVLANEQIMQTALKGAPHPGVAKAITLNAASNAISALLGVKPSATLEVVSTQPQTLKQAATKWINEAAQPTTAPAPAPTPKQPAPIDRLRQMVKLVPDSPHLKFALTNANGVVEFFSLDTVKSKYPHGTPYRTVRKLLGAPGDWHRAFMSVHQQLDVMRQWLRYGWEQGCKDYADKHGRCARCDAYLSDPQSIAAKVGKDCADALGWPW